MSELVGERVDLTDDHRLAGLDVGKERVENTARALRVLPGPERLLEAREDPHDGAVREAADDLLHAPLEHADVDLAGDHVGCVRLEREPAVEASQCLDDQRRLSRAGLPDEQHGPRRLGGQGGDDRVDRDRTGADDRPGRVLDRVDDPPELAEERGVQRAAPPLVDRRFERRSRRFAGRGENLVEERLQPGLKALEVVGGQPFTARPHGRRGTRATARASGVSLQSASAHRSTVMITSSSDAGERAEDELALAPLTIFEPLLRPSDPVLGRPHVRRRSQRSCRPARTWSRTASTPRTPRRRRSPGR